MFSCSECAIKKIKVSTNQFCQKLNLHYVGFNVIWSPWLGGHQQTKYNPMYSWYKMRIWLWRSWRVLIILYLICTLIYTHFKYLYSQMIFNKSTSNKNKSQKATTNNNIYKCINICLVCLYKHDCVFGICI